MISDFWIIHPQQSCSAVSNASTSSGVGRSFPKSTVRPAGNTRDTSDRKGESAVILKTFALPSIIMPKKSYHRGIVRVVLPPKGKARDRWLARDKVARLLRVCWRAREYQTLHRGPNKGTQIETDRRPLWHLARFILMALYTGTRSNAVTTASIRRGEGRSFVDLDNGIFVFSWPFHIMLINRCAERPSRRGAFLSGEANPCAHQIPCMTRRLTS